MACLGVLFALSLADVKKFKAFDDEDELLEFLTEDFEERQIGGEWAVEVDKSWDAIQRCFGDGQLSWESTQYPLDHIILCGEPLYSGDDYVISLKTAKEVRDIAEKIGEVTQADLRNRFNAIDPADFGEPLTEEEFDAAWRSFTDLCTFYKKAAEAKRAVMFTVDQ